MAEAVAEDPLERVLPNPEDRTAWAAVRSVVASDTGETVVEYEHRMIGRTLRLDAAARVYGHDIEGVVRLFGRGGPLALAVALNAVYDGFDQYRPRHVVVDPAEGSSRSL